MAITLLRSVTSCRNQFLPFQRSHKPEWGNLSKEIGYPSLLVRQKKSKNDREHFHLFSNKKIGITPLYNNGTNSVSARRLIKPFIFTVCFSGCTFVVAAILQYENMRQQAEAYLKSRKHYLLWSDNMPTYKKGEFRRQMHAWWNTQTDGQKLAWGIITANVLVLLLWRVPSIQPTLIKYFCSNPAAKSVCVPMFLSVFSHYSFFHFAANMFVLYSFSTAAVSIYGKEHFLAVYCSAGVISSFVSYIHKTATGKMGLSLGASGAVMAVLSSVCLQYPDAKLAIVFLPFFTFSAGLAIKAVLMFDTAGLILGWRLFDHAAHLGGALFGICHLFYGQDLIWKNREPVMRLWQNIREESRKK